MLFKKNACEKCWVTEECVCVAQESRQSRLERRAFESDTNSLVPELLLHWFPVFTESKSRSLNHHLTLQIDMDLQEFLADGVFLRPSDGRAYLHLKAGESIGRVDVLDCNNVQASRSVSSIPKHAIVSRKWLYQPVACSCDIQFGSLVTYLNLVNHLYTKLWSFHPQSLNPIFQRSQR